MKLKPIVTKAALREIEALFDVQLDFLAALKLPCNPAGWIAMKQANKF